MKPQIRNCWPVLSDKAKGKVVELQTAIATLTQRLDEQKSSRQRLLDLYDEYRIQEISGNSSSLGMQASMNQRQFMNQLLGLQQKVELEIQKAESLLAQQRKLLLMAELELQKMEALAEQDQKNVQLAQAKLEQRQMDDLGVVRYNLRSA